MSGEQDYWKFVRGMAEDILEEVGPCDYTDTLHEYVDGCEYVIYYGKMLRALIYSDNTEAIDDSSEGPGFWEFIQRATYHAVLADVEERINLIKEETEDESEDQDDDDSADDEAGAPADCDADDGATR